MNMKFLLRQLFAASAIVAVASSEASLRGRQLQSQVSGGTAPSIGDFSSTDPRDEGSLDDAPNDAPDDASDDGPSGPSDPLDIPDGPSDDGAGDLEGDLGNPDTGPEDGDAPVQGGDDSLEGQRPYANGGDPAEDDDGTPHTGSPMDDSNEGPSDSFDGSGEAPPDDEEGMATEPPNTGIRDDAPVYGGDDSDGTNGPSDQDQSEEPDDSGGPSGGGYVPPPDDDFVDPDDSVLYPGSQGAPSISDPNNGPPTPVGAGDAVAPEETYSGGDESLGDDDLEGSDSGPGSFNVAEGDQVTNDSDPGPIGR